MKRSDLLGLVDGIGEVRVESGGVLGWLVRGLAGLPLRGKAHTARLDITRTTDGAEIWIRRFGATRWFRPQMCSTLRGVDAVTILERWGLCTFTFDVHPGSTAGGPGCRLVLRASRLGVMRLGRRWATVDADVALDGDADGRCGGARRVERSTITTRLLGGRLGWCDYTVEIAHPRVVQFAKPIALSTVRSAA